MLNRIQPLKAILSLIQTQEVCMSDAYEKEVWDETVRTPEYTAGMQVMVRSLGGNKSIIGFGNPIKSKWSDFYSQHIYEIRLFNGDIISEVMTRQLKRIAYSGKTQTENLLYWTKMRVPT